MSTSQYAVGYSIRNEDDYALIQLGPALDEAAALGVDCVELALYAMELVANGRVLPDRLKRVKALTAGRPLGYTMHGPLGLNLMESEDRLPIHKDVLKATLEVTAELGGVHYVAHAGCIEPGNTEEVDTLFKRQREALAEVADFAASHGIVIVVENLFGGAHEAVLPSRLAEEVAAIGHPAVRACLDFSHAFLLSEKRGANFLEEAAALAPLAKHLHLHDLFGKTTRIRARHRAEQLAYGVGDLHLPLGLGSIPWDDLMERCRFPAGVIFINELAPHYWSDLPEVVERTRALAKTAKIGAAA